VWVSWPIAASTKINFGSYSTSNQINRPYDLGWYRSFIRINIKIRRAHLITCTQGRDSKKARISKKALKYIAHGLNVVLASEIVKAGRIRVISSKLPRLFRRQTGDDRAGRLARDVHGLKELLRVAWKELANPLLTPFERREARNQIERCGVELQRHLKLMEAERSRYRKRSLEENDGRSFSKPKLRLLAGGL